MSQLIIKYTIAICILIGFISYVIYSCNCNKYNQTKDYVVEMLPVIKHAREEDNKKTIEAQPHVNILNNLIADYIHTRDPTILISIGDFYRKGMYSVMKSDNDKALKYYRLAELSEDKHIAEIAQAKHAEAILNHIPEIDDDGVETIDDIPRTLLLEDIREYELYPIHEPQQQRQLPQHQEGVFLNDLQNVHDHYMNKITEHNIKKLRELTRTDNMYTSNQNIKNILLDELYKNEEFDDRTKVIIADVLTSFSDQYKQYDCSELDSLRLVYEFINNNNDRSTLLHNLFMQLNDCKENGIIVCTTGKISRVISVVGALDNFEHAKNIYYIKPELEHLAANVRDSILATLTDEQVDAYNNSAEGSDIITERMKKMYIDRVNDEYCNKLNFEYNIIRPHVEANLHSF